VADAVTEGDREAWHAATTQGARGGWTSARAAAILALFVLAIGWIGVRLLADAAVTQTPELAWTTFALISAAWVAIVIPGGVVDRARAGRVHARRRAAPREPWVWDHRWDPRGDSVPAWRRLARPSTFPLAFLVSQTVIMFGARRSGAVSPLWLIPAGVVVAWWAWRALRLVGAGTTHVWFTRFPYAPGERVTLHFGASDGGARFDRATFTLLRIEETPGAWIRSQHILQPTFCLEDRRPPGALPGPGQDVLVEFDVPADAGGTRLSAPLPEYWVLHVGGETSAGPYAESFLIPIYDRPVADVAP
jgi:hypothetical protein